MSNNVIILTNNPSLRLTKWETSWVVGDVEAVLLKARDFVHRGYRLVSHPLPASYRMFLSPYRSLLIEQHSLPICEDSLRLIEGSIDEYRKMMAKRRTDDVHAKDYAMVDQKLLLSALRENVSTT